MSNTPASSKGLNVALWIAQVFLAPSLTRIMPKLTVLAAIGCIALMLGAVVFHVSRGEADKTPVNFFLIAIAVFVAWGRSTKVPIAPRV